MQKTLTTLVAGLGLAFLLTGSTSTQAQQPPQRQGRGNFDPAQMRERMMERYREQLEVTNDAEWKLIEARIEAVSEARRGTMGGFGGFGGMGARRTGGPGQPGQPGQGGPGGFGGEPNPEVAALQKAIEDKASNAEIKAKLTALRESRKAAEQKLEQAQEELKKLLSVRQEGQAVMMGLLR